MVCEQSVSGTASQVHATFCSGPHDSKHFEFYDGIPAFGVGDEAGSALDEPPVLAMLLQQRVAQAVPSRGVSLQHCWELRREVGENWRGCQRSLPGGECFVMLSRPTPFVLPFEQVSQWLSCVVYPRRKLAELTYQSHETAEITDVGKLRELCDGFHFSAVRSVSRRVQRVSAVANF